MDRLIQFFKNYFRLLALYAKMDLLWFLRDTRYCLLYVFVDLVSAGSAISGVLLLSAKFGDIGGMSQEQILFMMGYSVMTSGLYMMLFGGGNVCNISRVVGRGQLDHKLIQPVPIAVQIFTEGFQPFSGSGKLIAGTGLILFTLTHSAFHVHFSALWFLTLVLNVLCSSLIILASNFIISCFAFLAPVSAEEISMATNDLFSTLMVYPLGGMSGWFITFLCTILPVGLAAWFPANVLLDRTPQGFQPSFLYVVTAAFVVVASILFGKGMIYYAKKGSTRYTGFGHR